MHKYDYSSVMPTIYYQNKQIFSQNILKRGHIILGELENLKNKRKIK